MELSLWSFNIGGFTDAAAWEPIVAAFNEANPDITVTVTPINYQDGDQKLTTAISSNSAPDIIFEGPALPLARPPTSSSRVPSASWATTPVRA